MAADMDSDAVRSRLEALCPILDQIQDNTRSASISIGVLHHGEVVFTRSRGFRDAESLAPVDSATNYLLCSLTKAFTAACCGILVDEGKLEWTKSLQSYIPFRSIVDPVIGERATMQDVLSHNTGLAHMDLTWLGVECGYILDKEDLLGVVSHLPPVHDLRRGFHYNNYMYAVAGSVIETQSGRPWYELLRERILEPLAMHRTVTNRAKLPDDNVAEPHVVLDDYSLHRQKPVDTAADNTLMGPAGSVWSNVSDMMKWAKALLDGIHDGPSVLKEVPTIVSHKSYITTSSIGENTHGLGFARAMIPSTELGMLSLNGPQREHIIGQTSRPRLVLYHNGDMSGYLTAFYLFPETKSAIVALGNSHGLGDGPDWSAQAIAQAMFDLQPLVDFDEVSKQRAKIEYERYTRLAADFEYFRNQERREEHQLNVNLEDYVGKYVNTGLKMALDIRHSTGESLTLVVNNVPSQHHQLTHFAGGKLGFLPSSREEFAIREFIDWFKWDQFILSFHRHEELGTVNGVSWALQNGIKPM
ncbi:beta-lactamase transpeptidase [Fusarium subglutinans]|uniref:Beta-lactamase transpeptidase n=1 Tax=Gibberella subglutinans TaxID=42677 RepID=A0A8H5L899_GIBSU|nr:beta-lactamase transpeptidase [Fusarium subglutinans]KAF5586001.1 beta-lactamase transpeptidase [Fusarium subglutinans]